MSDTIDLAELKAELTRLSEVVGDLTRENARVREENDGYKARFAEAEAERRTRAAEKWCEARSSAKCLKILPHERRLAVALYSELSAWSDRRISFAEKEGAPAVVVSPAQLLEKLIDRRVDQKHLLSELARDVYEPQDFEDALQLVAKRDGLDVKKHSERRAACETVAAEFPELCDVPPRRSRS